MKIKLSSALWACALGAFVLQPLPARADDALARAISSSIIIPANMELRDIMEQSTPAKKRPPAGLPTGLTYTADLSFGYQEGNTGSNARFPGGLDAAVTYGFNHHNRLEVGYYQLQQYPIGFNTGTVPVFLQGLGAPIGTQALSQLGINATTVDKLFTISDQNLFEIGGKPIIISPTYTARSSKIGGPSDVETVEINGFPQTIHQRTAETYLLPVTVPFLATPRMFGTVTAAAQWNVNTNGANAVGNKAQIFEAAYVEYRFNRTTKFFVQPSRIVSYLPLDPYPQFIPTMMYGFAHRFTKNTFGQVLAISGTPSNNPTAGILSLTCQQIAPNGQCTTAVPAIGGLRATFVQIQFGIGSPSVIPI